MSEEKREQTAPAAEAEPTTAKKSPLTGYLVYGGIGLVLVAATIFGTLMILGGPAPVATDETAAADSLAVDTAHAEAKTHAETKSHDQTMGDMQADSLPAYLVDEPDTNGILKDIQANLDFLDYRPEESTRATEKMSREDSIEAVNWLKEEKARLAAREKELADREKQLDVLDKKVSQKILRIEQAESAKIQSLAKLYDNMDPRSVAQLAANLDDATMVAILPRMKQKNASQVLALMPAQRAARLSKQMITIAGN